MQYREEESYKDNQRAGDVYLVILPLNSNLVWGLELHDL